MVETLEERVGPGGELPISRPLDVRHSALKITHRIANAGAVIGGLAGLVYSQIANADPLPTVAQGVAYGLAIPYIVFTLAYGLKNQLSGGASEI